MKIPDSKFIKFHELKCENVGHTGAHTMFVGSKIFKEALETEYCTQETQIVTNFQMNA